jgi:hypothetical protein
MKVHVVARVVPQATTQYPPDEPPPLSSLAGMSSLAKMMRGLASLSLGATLGAVVSKDKNLAMDAKVSMFNVDEFRYEGLLYLSR